MGMEFCEKCLVVQVGSDHLSLVHKHGSMVDRLYNGQAGKWAMEGGLRKLGNGPFHSTHMAVGVRLGNKYNYGFAILPRVCIILGRAGSKDWAGDIIGSVCQHTNRLPRWSQPVYVVAEGQSIRHVRAKSLRNADRLLAQNPTRRRRQRRIPVAHTALPLFQHLQ